MTDRDLLELIATQVDKLTSQVDGLTRDMVEVKATMATLATKDELAEVKSEVNSIKAIVVRIENDHGQKLGALFDGYKLMSERLDRIEKEVTKHEEIILRRIE